MIKINLKDNVYLLSDERNFMIAEELYRTKEDGTKEAYWSYAGFFASLNACINLYITRYNIKKSDCSTLDEICALLKKLEKHKSDVIDKMESGFLKEIESGDDECMDTLE